MSSQPDATPETGYSQIEANVLSQISFAWRRAVFFGTAYYTIRVALIVLSALASAKAVGVAGKIDKYQAVSALFVTILTALDTWLKTGERYRVHYEYDDQFRDLMIKLDLSDKNDREELRELANQLADTRSKYRKALSWA